MLAQSQVRTEAATANGNERVEMVAEGVSPGWQANAVVPGNRLRERIRVLLVEDDDGDALLLEELLLDAGQPFLMTRARTLAEAGRATSDVSCVLLGLELRDSRGLQAVRVLREASPNRAVVVLTGFGDDHLEEEAVKVGAQDYLVKGKFDGPLLDRVVRHAVERQRAEVAKRALQDGLLPTQVLPDDRLEVAKKYLPGGQQIQVGGDFWDVVQAPDDWVHAIVGDVCGHGPVEAALGVCLRVAWRTMILAGRPAAETLTALQAVLEHERQHDRLFATFCMLSISPDRMTGHLRLGGHPQPLLITADAVRELAAPVRLPAGIMPATDWPSAQVNLGQSWSVLMYTDGLIEGKTGRGADRLGSDGLIGLIEEELAHAMTQQPPDQSGNQRLIEAVVSRVRKLNGGDLDDDLAVLAISCAPKGQGQ